MTIDIEFIGDFICPWCYLGKVRLERVREKLLPDIELNIKVKPYVLYPNIPKGGTPKSHFAKKAKRGMGKALKYEAQIENIAFNYRLIERIPYSWEAHRLVWLIEDNDKKYELSKLIFHDYFEKGQDIESSTYLISAAKSIGIDEAILQAFANSDAGTDEVKNYVQACRDEYITLVPYLKIHNMIGVPGLQSAEVLENYIRRVGQKHASAHPKNSIE